MLLSTKDQLHVDSDAFNFAMKHHDLKFGVGLRRSDIVRAAEHAADSLPALDDATHRDAREIATIYRFASQVFKHLGLENATIA